MKAVSKNRVFPVIAILVSAMLALSIMAFGVTPAQAKTGSKSSSKVVVLYFSGTGNTQNVAKKIRKSTGGTLIRINAADPYTDADLDYSNDNSRVVREHESAASPAESTGRKEDGNKENHFHEGRAEKDADGHDKTKSGCEGRRFSGGASQSDITAWVQSLNLN